LTAVSVSVSGWTLVAISIERFYAICHPLTSRRWQTTRHARIVILIVWIISLAIMSPVAILSELKPVGSDGKQLSDRLVQASGQINRWPCKIFEMNFSVNSAMTGWGSRFLLIRRICGQTNQVTTA
jgi:7 transmembrane receptor (rhodopsin family)